MSAPPLNGGIAQDMVTSDVAGFRRLQVDQAQTSFFEGREFRIARKLSITAGTPLVLRFTSAVDFILAEQELNTTTGDIEFFAWRETQGTPGGTWAGSITPIGKNISAEFKQYGGARYATQVTISTGGTFTPTDSNAYVDYDRAKTAGATAQQASVSGGADSSRYLAAGTYYLVLSSLDATSVGRFVLAWEERP
jgi:hypothetical protein